MATLVLMHSGVNGFVMVLLPTANGRFFDVLVGIGNVGGFIVLNVMWDLVMNLKREFPRIHRIYMTAALLGIMGLPFVASGFYRTLAPLSGLLGTTVILLSLVLIVILLFRHGLKANLIYFFLGFFATAVGAGLTTLMTIGVIPLNVYTVNGYQFSSILHILFLAIGLAHRIRDIEKARIQARQELSLETRRAEDQRHFVALLSHEFRSPLAVINKAAQMIQITMPKIEHDVAERLDRIRQRATQLSRLVDSFLTSQALEHGSHALKKTPTDLGRLFNDIIISAEAKEQVCTTTTPTRLVWSVDKDLFAIAVGNLVDNALKYSPPNSPITIEASTNASGLELLIQDWGLGMSSEEIARVGTMYFRGKSAQDVKGTGLGLHISGKIVAAHGGILEVQSRGSDGTTVAIRIPRQHSA
ncbi:MAG: HAMP domain-containing histidine kinase [Magnetovibrio sp.]|nr:HAMP domain-containing histidine kinase [Magnetovibrio sp.]